MAMELIKVVVTELPEFCDQCPYCMEYPSPDGMYHGDKECVVKMQLLTDVDTLNEVPEGCPLVAEKDGKQVTHLPLY